MKKQTIKMFSAILAVMVMLSCVPLKAVTAGTHVYELYQIFTGTFSTNGVLSDVKWGQNGKQPVGEPADGRVSDAVLKALNDVNNGSDTEKLAVINQYVNLESVPYRGESAQPTSNGDGTEFKYTGIEPGYYLIKDKTGSQNGEGSVYTLYVAETSGNTLVFKPKEGIPTVTKKINDDGSKNLNEASIGEEVNFEITGTVPQRINDYATYYYRFADTLSKGLTFKEGSAKVIVKNGTVEEDVTGYFFTKVGTYSDTTGTEIDVAIADLKALANLVTSTGTKLVIDEKTQIVLTYTATLNENALINDANTNEVKLIYSNDPNNSGVPSQLPPTPPTEFPNPNPQSPVGETVKSTTETYTTFLELLKVDENREKLTGAIFTLTGNGVKQVLVKEQVFTEAIDGTYYKLKDGTYTETVPTDETAANYDSTTVKYKKDTVTTLKGENQTETTVQGTVDDNGIVRFTGLGAGEYTLTETKAPDGYNKIDPINFTITFDPATKTFATTVDTITYQPADGGLHSEIVNKPGTTLPSTGGIGTKIFYTVGSILALGAFVAFVVKRRMRHENM